MAKGKGKDINLSTVLLLRRLVKKTKEKLISTGDISNLIFWIILWSLTLNLGIHFSVNWQSALVLPSYLIPTIYLQDFLICFYILCNISKLKRFILQTLQTSKWPFVALPLLFVSTLLLHLVLIRSYGCFIASVYLTFRFALYLLFVFLIVTRKSFVGDIHIYRRVFLGLFLFESLLAIAQFMHKGSVFPTYLFFGEQPYSFSTYGMSHTLLLGRSYVLPLGTFQHTNVLGAFLVFALTFVLGSKRLSWSSLVLFLLGLFAILSTFSFLALIVLGVSILLLFLPKRFFCPAFLILLLLAFSVSVLLVVTPLNLPSFVSSFLAITSLKHRYLLAQLAIQSVKTSWFLGLGLGSLPQFVANTAHSGDLLTFIQPVHNAWLLLLAEVGLLPVVYLLIFAYLLFVQLCLFFKSPVSGRYIRLLLALLFQLVVFSFFDHFVLTSPQFLLLSCLTIGIALQYNLK